jgi:hypothetical protein
MVAPEPAEVGGFERGAVGVMQPIVLIVPIVPIVSWGHDAASKTDNRRMACSFLI